MVSTTRLPGDDPDLDATGARSDLLEPEDAPEHGTARCTALGASLAGGCPLAAALALAVRLAVEASAGQRPDTPATVRGSMGIDA